MSNEEKCQTAGRHNKNTSGYLLCLQDARLYE